QMSQKGTLRPASREMGSLFDPLTRPSVALRSLTATMALPRSPHANRGGGQTVLVFVHWANSAGVRPLGKMKGCRRRRGCVLAPRLRLSGHRAYRPAAMRLSVRVATERTV